MADEELRGSERYLDEVEPPPPPRWRVVLGGVVCLLLIAAIVVGAKLWLFSELSVASFAIRSFLVGIILVMLWLLFFRRRITTNP